MFMLSAIILTIAAPLVVPVSVTVFHAIAGANRRMRAQELIPNR
jgi:hypothetical protein